MYLARYFQPKLTGVVIKEAVKCGRRNCRCAEGKPHRWYYYHYFRRFENSVWKLEKQYVPRSKVKYLRRKIRKTKDKENKINKGLTMNAFLLTATNNYIKGKIPKKDYSRVLHEIAQTN